MPFTLDNIESTHPRYLKLKKRWKLVRDFYEAEVIDKPQVYLSRYKMSEGAAEYQWRAAEADYTNHLARIIDGFAGLLFSVEGDIQRTLQRSDMEEGLGSLTDTASVAGKVGRNITGDGTDYPTQWRKAAPLLLVYHQLWGVIRNPSGSSPQHKIIRPEAVTDLIEDGDGRITEAKVVEVIQRRRSLLGTVQETRIYTHYRLDGYTQYALTIGKNGKKKALDIIEEGDYAFFDDAEKTRRILPIYRVKLPLPRYVMWSLAKKAQVIFNKESQRDHILSLAQMPLFMFDDSGRSDFDTFVEKRRQGHNVISGTGHEWLTVDSDPAKLASEVLARKVDELYYTAFQEYSDSAAQRTATEINQDFTKGIQSFLVLYKNALDEYENEWLKRLEQTVFPQRSDLWGQAHVKRSENFNPADIETLLQRRKDRYFGGKPLPVDDETLADLTLQMLKEDGVEISEDREEAIRQQVRVFADQRDQADDIDIF